ncbi:LacI family transcriptional regulator [Alphaproteobacteria bacterium]|nr:LacI family transcriptional regulator [Alphaproteobacteria bacterium]
MSGKAADALRGKVKRATLAEVANAVGLAKPTVSRALNDYPDISEETKRRVRETAAALGYVASSRARQLQKGSTDAIGLVISSASVGLQSAYQSEFTSALAAALDGHGLDLLLHSVADPVSEIDTYNRLFQQGKVDGFVLMRTRCDDERIRFLTERGVPFVTQGRTDQSANHAWIDIDSQQAFSDAVEFLASKGHQRIAMIAGDETIYSSTLRNAGYRQGLEKAGIALDPDLIFSGDFSAASGRVGLKRVMDAAAGVTAILCANDATAMGAISQAVELGIDVPSQLSVMGYDGVRMAEMFSPPLTTLSHSAAECGERIASMIVGLVGGDAPTDHQILLPAQIIERRSTGMAANV